MINRQPRENCGVFGVICAHPQFKDILVPTTLAGLFENQHRGEESAGIATANGKQVSPTLRRMGLIKSLYDHYQQLPLAQQRKFFGHLAAAHTRYSTTGSSSLTNAGPFIAIDPVLGGVAVAHNGNLTNAKSLQQKLVKLGCTFKATSDSELIPALIVKSPGSTWLEKIKAALSELEGSFSLVIVTADTLYGVREGNRPLSYAKFEKDESKGYALSSETAAFRNLEMEYAGDVLPGQIVSFDLDGTVKFDTFIKKSGERLGFCALEIAYLMRPDSRIMGVQLSTFRRALGAKLAKYFVPEHIDFVTYIPESARATAEGLAAQLNLPTQTTMLKNRYGSLDGKAFRGFINPDPQVRKQVAHRYAPLDGLAGSNVLLVDDSVIRGTTTGGVVELIRNKVGVLQDLGVHEVHLRIIFPPVVSDCKWGVDINGGLLTEATGLELQKMAKYLGVDSIEFLTADQFQECINVILGHKIKLCFACTRPRMTKPT